MIRYTGRTISKGEAKGTALVTRMAISFTGGVDPSTGIVVEKGHELEGQCVAGKILVFPSGKGSTTGSWQFYVLYKRGNAPIGIINDNAEGVVAASAIITNTPMIHRLEGVNCCAVIRTGDSVAIYGDDGYVELDRG